MKYGYLNFLKRGIQAASAPFCAPMQLFHGVAAHLAASGADWIFVPRIRSLPGVTGQRCSIVCPIVQAAPKVVEHALGSTGGAAPRILAPVINIGAGNLESKEFLESCRKCAIINLCMLCPAHAHLETGELDKPSDVFCKIAHARAEALKKRMSPDKAKIC